MSKEIRKRIKDYQDPEKFGDRMSLRDSILLSILESLQNIEDLLEMKEGAKKTWSPPTSKKK